MSKESNETNMGDCYYSIFYLISTKFALKTPLNIGHGCHTALKRGVKA